MANANIGIKGWRNYSSFSLFAAGSARADKNTAILVDTASGNLSVVSTDWVLPGRIPCPITRTYNHLDDTSTDYVDRPFGPGWSWQFDMVLFGYMDPEGPVTWKAADGSEYEFTNPTGGGTLKTYTSPAGLHQYILTHDSTRDNQFELAVGKIVYAFRASHEDDRARLMEIHDLFGNGLLINRTMGGGDEPTKIIESIGRRYWDDSESDWAEQTFIVVTYNEETSCIELLEINGEDSYQIKLAYTYGEDPEGYLVQVDPLDGSDTSLNMEIEYSYDTSSPYQMIGLKDTIGAKAGSPYGWTFNYNGSNEVSSVVFPIDSSNTGTVSYIYDTSEPTDWSHADPDTWNKVTDALGKDWYYGQDTSGQVHFSVDPLWEHSSHESYTEYAYNSDHQVTSVSVPQPNGEASRNTTSYYYNSNKNLAAVVDAYGFVSWYKYGSRTSYGDTGTGATVNDVIGIFTPAPGQAAYDDSDHTDSETVAPTLSSPVNVDSFVSWDTSNLYWKYSDGTTPTAQVIELARTVVDYTYADTTGQLTSLRSCSPANFAESTATSYTLTTASGASQQEFDDDTGDLIKSYTPRQFKNSGTYGYTEYTHDEVYGVVSEVENADSILASAGKTTEYTYNELRTRVIKVTLPESVSDSQFTESEYNEQEYLLGTVRPDIDSWGVDPQLSINEYDYNGNLTKVYQADPEATGTRWNGNPANGYNEVRGASYDRINRTTSSYVKVDWDQDSTVETLMTSMTYDDNGNVTMVIGPEYYDDQATPQPRFTYNFTDYDELGRIKKVYITIGYEYDTLTAPPANTEFTEYIYDLAGNVVEVRDPMYSSSASDYHKTLYTYDWLNRRIKTTGYYEDNSSPVAISTEQHFDASGGVYWSMDGEGYKMYPERDLSGRMVAMHRGTSNGDADERVYDADSHLVYYYSYEDVDASKAYRTRNEYDEMGRLVNSGREEYDSGTSTYINWNSNTADATFNYNGWAIRSYDKVNTGKYTERVYDDWGQLTKVKAPEVPDPSGVGTVVYETEYYYNVLGQRIQADDHEDNSTYYYYDLLGRQIKVKNALNYETKTYYDARSLRWKVVRPSTAYTEFLYDDARRLATSTVYHDSTSEETEYTYNLNGQVTQVDYADGGINKFTYDELGRRVKSETLLDDPGGDAYLATEYEYDDNNKVVLTTAPGGYEYESEYDDLGNLTSSTNPASEETTYTYDKDNRLITKTDAVGVVATKAYDWKTGRTSSVVTEINATAADDITVSYTYDDNGRPTGITDGRGYAWAKAYDALGRMTTLTTPNPGSGAYTHTIVYDGNSNITKTTDFKSVSHYYAYDALNRMSGHGATSSANDETYTYACCGAQLSAYTDSSGTASLSYDQLGRLTSFTDSQGYNVAYAYDELGRVETLTPDQGANYKTEYDYYKNGSVKNVRVYDGGTAAETSYEYSTSSGKLTQRDFPTVNSQYLRTAYAYDSAGRLEYETLTRQTGGTNLSRAVYSYSISSYERETIRTEQVEDSGWANSWQMIYRWDGLGRQVYERRNDEASGWSQMYVIEQEYDKNGNRTGYEKSVTAGQETNYGNPVDLSYTYNNVNALTSIADGNDGDYSCTVTCDANGNITQVSEVQAGTPSAGLVSAFTYDALNRMTVMEATQKQSGVTQYTKRQHGYDALGRLTASALTQWDAGDQEPTAEYRDHLYAGARHIGNAGAGFVSTTYGARWHWGGGQQDHAAPLESPNADTAGQKGYNIARKQSPQQSTWQSPTSAGDDKLLYGQGRPMAKDAVGGGANFADGLESENTGGTVTVESRLFFDGTVASSSSANDLSRATDAREKGRIGIFGSALAYAGSYGRVTSESIGRDLNPLGRGDGSAYVAGGMNLGRISPALPWNNSPGGWGNSVNNGCGDSGSNGLDGPTGLGGDISTTSCDPSECEAAGIPSCCCCPWPCRYSPETHNIVGPAVRECSCPVECSHSGIRCTGELEPNWTNWCEGQNGAGNGGSIGSEGGCPGCGGSTEPWGLRNNGGGGGMPGLPPGWRIPGRNVTGPLSPIDYPGGELFDRMVTRWSTRLSSNPLNILGQLNLNQLGIISPSQQYKQCRCICSPLCGWSPWSILISMIAAAINAILTTYGYLNIISRVPGTILLGIIQLAFACIMMIISLIKGISIWGCLVCMLCCMFQLPIDCVFAGKTTDITLTISECSLLFAPLRGY